MKKVTFIKISESKTTDKKFAMVQVENPNSLTVGGVVCITRASLNGAGLEFFRGKKKGDEVNVNVEFTGERLEDADGNELTIEKVRINANV